MHIGLGVKRDRFNAGKIFSFQYDIRLKVPGDKNNPADPATFQYMVNPGVIEII